jgi:cytochrome c-type biogenesis protein
MTFAINGGSVIKGTLLGVSYSSGLAIPFLVAALGISWVTTLLRKYAKVMRVAEIVMGVILVIAGILLFAGSFNVLASFVPFFNFGL